MKFLKKFCTCGAKQIKKESQIAAAADTATMNTDAATTEPQANGHHVNGTVVSDDPIVAVIVEEGATEQSMQNGTAPIMVVIPDDQTITPSKKKSSLKPNALLAHDTPPLDEKTAVCNQQSVSVSTDEGIAVSPSSSSEPEIAVVIVSGAAAEQLLEDEINEEEEARACEGLITIPEEMQMNRPQPNGFIKKTTKEGGLPLPDLPAKEVRKEKKKSALCCGGRRSKGGGVKREMSVQTDSDVNAVWYHTRSVAF